MVLAGGAGGVSPKVLHAARVAARRETLQQTTAGATRVERYGSRRARVASRRPKHARAQSGLWGGMPLLVMTAIVLAVLVKGFVVQAFFIPSRSMWPTLEVGDRVVVSRLAYRVGEPSRGQVVVFLRPTSARQAGGSGAFWWMRRAVAQGLGGTPPGSEDLIKRVIGVPGDVLQGRAGRLWRNGRPLNEPYLAPWTWTSDFGPVRVAPDHYWVMGDNRQDSADSRFFGQVPRSALVGRALVRIWPGNRLGEL